MGWTRFKKKPPKKTYKTGQHTRFKHVEEARKNDLSILQDLLLEPGNNELDIEECLFFFYGFWNHNSLFKPKKHYVDIERDKLESFFGGKLVYTYEGKYLTGVQLGARGDLIEIYGLKTRNSNDG